MLRFTGSGIVPSPERLQLRVTRRFPGRVRAGAPEPARSLTPEEVIENLRWFTEGKRGPRTRPVRGLVLSGVALAQRHDLADAIAQGRTWGIERVTLHLAPGGASELIAGPLAGRVDAVAVTVRSDQGLADLAALRDQAVEVTPVVVLDAIGLEMLDRRVEQLIAMRPSRVVLTWPMVGDAPPHATQAGSSAMRAVGALRDAGISCGVKGLPICRLGGDTEAAWRSGNRWYVDAAHQLDAALLFFPGVVRFAKADRCRFCAADGRCDGVPEPWLEQGLAGVLEPLPHSIPPSD